MALLDRSWAYSLARRLTGSDRLNHIFARDYIRAAKGTRILDLGCGTGDILRFLPNDIEYIGIDSNPRYIHTAQQLHGHRAKFLLKDVDTLDLQELGKFDRVTALGVIHHLNDDEAVKMMVLAKNCLVKGGTFVSYDPCFKAWQNPVARLVHSLDRGEHVRYVDSHQNLVEQVFSKSYKLEVRTDLCFIPSTAVIVESCP